MVLAAVREDRMPGGRNSGAVYNMYKVKYKKKSSNGSRSADGKKIGCCENCGCRSSASSVPGLPSPVSETGHVPPENPKVPDHAKEPPQESLTDEASKLLASANLLQNHVNDFKQESSDERIETIILQNELTRKLRKSGSSLTSVTGIKMQDHGPR